MEGAYDRSQSAWNIRNVNPVKLGEVEGIFAVEVWGGAFDDEGPVPPTLLEPFPTDPDVRVDQVRLPVCERAFAVRSKPHLHLLHDSRETQQHRFGQCCFSAENPRGRPLLRVRPGLEGDRDRVAEERAQDPRDDSPPAVGVRPDGSQHFSRLIGRQLAAPPAVWQVPGRHHCGTVAR